VNNHITLLTVMAIVLGASVALLAEPERAQSTFDTKIHIYSGAEYGSSILFCGWHTTCTSFNIERGLDWDSTSNDYGYFNAWAFSHDSFPTIKATGIPGDIRPGPLSNCTTTSIDIRDLSGTFQSRFYYVHVSRTISSQFSIYADDLFAAGGEWQSRIVGNQITQTGCTSTGTHAMTWYDGLVPGVYNTFPRDPWWNCSGYGWPSGFYFPCSDPTTSCQGINNSWCLPHDLSDWGYYTLW
jgi:hypothetical protein